MFGETQGVVHTPATQVCPLAQALPHAPQFVALVRTSVQTPPHTRLGEVQGVVHTPATQVCPVAQALSQRPQ